MPRTEIFSERRLQLVEALLRIAADRGLEEVSIREVAAAGNVSIGTVQYYFGTKDDMLLCAYQHVVDEVLRRLKALDTHGTVGQVLRRSVMTWLPLDEERTTAARAGAAFAARAVVAPRLADLQGRLNAGVRARLQDLVSRAKETKEIPEWVDPGREAAVILALVNGLTMQVLTDPKGLQAAGAEAVLHAYLGRMFDVTGERAPVIDAAL